MKNTILLSISLCMFMLSACQNSNKDKKGGNSVNTNKLRLEVLQYMEQLPSLIVSTNKPAPINKDYRRITGTFRESPLQPAAIYFELEKFPEMTDVKPQTKIKILPQEGRIFNDIGFDWRVESLAYIPEDSISAAKENEKLLEYYIPIDGVILGSIVEQIRSATP